MAGLIFFDFIRHVGIGGCYALLIAIFSLCKITGINVDMMNVYQLILIVSPVFYIFANMLSSIYFKVKEGQGFIGNVFSDLFMDIIWPFKTLFNIIRLRSLKRRIREAGDDDGIYKLTMYSVYADIITLILVIAGFGYVLFMA